MALTRTLSSVLMTTTAVFALNAPAAAADVTVAVGTTSTLNSQTTDRYVVDGTLQVLQASSDIVSVDKSDTIYGDYAASTVLGSSGTLTFRASAYFIAATIGFVDSSGRIVSVLTTNNDDVYNLLNSLSGAALLGADCASSGLSACVTATGATQDLLPTINSLNGNLSLCCGAARFDVIIGSGVIDSRIASLAGSGTVELTSGNLVIDNGADNFLGTIIGSGGLEIAGGRQILSGANSYSGGTFVTGGVVVANNTQAFGTGTIHMIDPTISFAASGTYTNDISLEVAAPASADPTIFQVNPGVNVILSGTIATGTTATTDPVQFVTIDGAGSVTLTGTGNSWLGTTTINGGATLQGTSDTISGGSIIVDGALNYVQATGGTVAQDISGAGRIGVSGLGAGETLTFAGNLTNNGINLTDGSSIALGGAANETSGDAILVFGNDASVSILNGAAVISHGDQGILSFGSNTNVDNQGSLTGANFIGVALYGGGSIVNGSSTNSTALIEGDNTGSFNGGATVSVDNYGVIRGLNFDGIGGGDLAITNRSTGQIIGQGDASQFNSFGIVASGALTLDNAGQIVGRFAGVRSDGAIDLTNSGLIGSGYLTGTTFSYSDGNDGIQAVGGGTIDNLAGGQILGSISGIYAANAPLTVTNAGTIHGNQHGIFSDAALTLTNEAGGSIDGPVTGIQLNANANVVTNSGSISGEDGIYSNGSVTLTNQLGGTISGTGSAFHLAGTGAGTITNFGDLTNGVVSTGGGNLSIDNRASGNVVRVAFGSAIDMSNGGALTVTNAGDIVGSGWGIVGRNAADSITNSGRIASGTISGETITVGGNHAIQLDQGGSVTNLAGGQISGNVYGVISFNRLTLDNRSDASITSNIEAVTSTGANSIVTNSGSIASGTDAFDHGVYLLGANSTVTNNVGGTITGTRAVRFDAAGATLNNSGTISSTAAQGFGALLFSGGTVNNFAEGTISGQYRGVSIQGAAGTITNAGTIRSTTEVAALLFNGGTVTNQAGGLIDGQYRGVTVSGGLGTVTNAGTIRATVDNAVSLFGGGSVTNQAGGTLTALGSGGWGIYGTGGALTIANAGTINADSGIVTNANGAIVTNNGTINGTVDGVNNLVGTSLTLNNNGGTIIATNRTGVRAEGALVLTNSGTIRSNAAGTADGVTVLNGAAATITNSGTISAATASGIAVTGASTISNSGMLTGGGDATYGYGVQFATGSSGSLVNQSGGTIGGGSGSVLLYTDNAVSLDLQAGSTANGAIVSTGAGARTVDVAGTLNGVYNSSAGTGIDTLTLAATGSIGGASLGAGADSFTTRGGAIGGAVSGGADLDVLTYDIAGTASYNAGLFAEFETRSKIGAGTLTLTGTDAMTSDFAVNGGTLVLSGGAAFNDAAALVTASGTTTRIVGANEQVRTISGAGAIDLGANALILGGNDSSTYSGVISGSGSLAKFGTGILTLTGSNSYTGLTQISGGTLRLGASDVIANASTVLVASGATFDLAGFNETIGGLTGAGTVALGVGRLTVDQSASTLFSGVITGTGGLTKAGNGLLDLTGASTYTGATFVNGGILAVNGSLLSAVTVNNGGTLRGTGTVGGLSVLSGGILAPGNSIGTMNVAGNLSFAAGSIYQVEVTPTAADRTNATGNITIAGGTVQVLATGSAYNPLTRYTILNAGGSVSGTFASVTSNLAFLTPGLEYDTRNVVLVLRRNDIDFTDVAVNPNQAGVAAAVQSLGISPLYDAVLVQSASGAQAADDALSGEVYASTATAILARGDRLQDAMASNQQRKDGLALWADAGRSWGTFDSSNRRGSALAKTDSEDLFAGFNWRRGTLAATLAGGRMIDKVEVDARLSDAKVHSWLLGGQLAYGEDLGLRAFAGGHYAWHKVDTDRGIVFPGFAETASSDRDGRGHHLFAQVGYASVTSGITLEPFAGLQHDRVKLDSLQENGGLAALDVASSSHSLTTAQLGLKIATTANLGWAAFTPRASVAFQHLMGDRTGSMQAGFLSGGIDFDVTGATLARNSAKVGLDLDFDFGGAKLVAGYNGTIGGVSDEHTAKVALQVRF